jgi:alanine racemase
LLYSNLPPIIAAFHFPVIGLTGNGKTIVKEWLNFLLSPDFNVIRSPKSYNSQVGVPLSIFAINEKHNLGVFEQEFLPLTMKLKRSFSLPLNLTSSSHDEGFLDLEEKLKKN